MGGELEYAGIEWIVADAIDASVGPPVHFRGFIAIQWPGADSTEDSDLVTRFVDGTIAIDPSRNA